jgi:hypothetical protein
MVTAHAERELDRIAALVTARVAGHEGRLSWMRIRCRREHLDEVRRELPVRLAEHGLDFIHIDVQPGEGEAAIEDMGWEPGWA